MLDIFLAKALNKINTWLKPNKTITIIHTSTQIQNT